MVALKLCQIANIAAEEEAVLRLLSLAALANQEASTIARLLYLLYICVYVKRCILMHPKPVVHLSILCQHLFEMIFSCLYIYRSDSFQSTLY